MTVIEVAIGPGGAPGTFHVEVVASPAGEASATVELDTDALLARRRLLQQAVLASAVPSRLLLPETEHLVRDAGQILFAGLLGTGEVAGRYRAAAAVAAVHGEGLRVVLRIDTPALAGLPWEAMYDQAAGAYVCRQDQLVRHVPVASVPAPLRIQPPLRILGVVSSPRGLPALDVEKEQDHLARALARPAAQGLAELHWAPTATWADLQDLLLDGEWHVLHFIGHGDFDPERDEGVLALVREDGRADLVAAHRLTDLLRQARPMPRLVVLNSCSGAAAGISDLFSGTAAALVRGGVSAVAAMQFKISDPAAVAFARGFYAAIARGRGVDDAVSSGRVAILGLSDRTLEWVTPVLYLRGHDARLFTLPASAEDTNREGAGNTRGGQHGGTTSLDVAGRGPRGESPADQVSARAPLPVPPTSLSMSEVATGLSGPPVIIEHKIGVALAGRKAQREFAASLSGRWGHLADTWANLVVCVEDLGARAAEARSADRAEADMFTDLAAYLAASANWRERSALVSARINQCTDLVQTLSRRVHRDTVNIGVIGQTGAGKSTLLRKLSGLGEEHIPSNKLKSTTATPIRIFHEPGSGAGRAMLTLHTWKSFRDEVLVPLHQKANIPGVPPTSVEDFRRFTGYGDDPSEVPAGQLGTLRYRYRLRWAQDSLPSYQDLLQGGTREISLDQLRPFIAYPRDEDPRPDYRPYHAVRSADVFCSFPEAGTVSLCLVEIPGTGEAGLDVHRRFLNELRNNDLLFIVKRPTKMPGNDPDWDLAQLADDAAAGVRRSDFVRQVINQDDGIPNEFFASALAQARAIGKQIGIDVFDCNIESSTPALVAQAVLSPVLAALADRLAYMDRAAAMLVLAELAEITAQSQSLTGELAHWIDRRRSDLPDEETRRRARVRELTIEIGAGLRRVQGQYGRLDQQGAPTVALLKDIEKAGREVRQWATEGLGTGSTEEWLRQFNDAVAPFQIGRELDRQYNNARKQMTRAFGAIDASVHRLMDRLWGDVADVLRAKLTEAIVPTGPDNRATLVTFADIARQAKAWTLAEATERLLDLPSDYGSIFFRVGRPLIRQVTWAQEELQSETKKFASGLTGPVSHDEAAPTVHLNAAEENAAASNASTRGPGIGEAPMAGAGTPEALAWHAGLSRTIELVITELTHEFHIEAQRALQTLIAAVDFFIDTVTVASGSELEFERLSQHIQREIWPADFEGPAARIATDLAVLRWSVTETDAAAGQVASLAEQNLRL